MRSIPYLKNAINIKYEAIYNISYLKEIALDILKTIKLNLRVYGKEESRFTSL